jgi:hypothetical protein
MSMLTFPRFAVQSTTVAQPMIGSFITAGIGAPAGQLLTLTLGNLCAGSGVSDSQLFIPGQEALLIDPGGINAETVRVKSIVAGANVNQIVIGPKTNVMASGRANPVTENPHVSGVFGTGTWILLHVQFNSIFLQPEDGGAGAFLYFGNSIFMTPTYKRAVKLASVASGSQPNSFSSTQSSPGDPFTSSEWWALGGSGNSNDSYMVTLNQA